MIDAFIGAAKALAKKPALFLPAIIVTAIVFGLFFLFAPLILPMVIDVLLLGSAPEVPLGVFPFYFGAMYAESLLVTLLYAVLVALAMLSASYCYAVIVREGGRKKFGVSDALAETIKALGKLLSLMVFVLLVAFLVGVIVWEVLLLVRVSAALAAVLLVVLVLFVLYLYIRLAFTVQAMAIEEVQLREAFEAAWRFSGKRLLAVIVFIVVVSALNNAIVAVGFGLADYAQEIAGSILVSGLFTAVSVAFCSLATAMYYAGKKKGK